MVFDEGMGTVLGNEIAEFVYNNTLVLSLAGFSIYMLYAYYRRLGRLQKENDELSAPGDSQPLMNVVRFIMDETDFGKRKTDNEVLVHVIGLGAGKTISIRGRKATLYMMKPHLGDDFYSDIPEGFLKHCSPFSGGFQVGFALIEPVDVEHLDDYAKNAYMTRAYLDPRVSMEEIKRHYCTDS